MSTIYQRQRKNTKRATAVSAKKKRRLPQLRRAKTDSLPPFHLTKRDRAIIRAVYEYRAMTSGQIYKLLFVGYKPGATVSSRCLQRLKLLFHHGFLYRSEQPQLLTEGRKPLVYWLKRRGAELFAEMAECTVKQLDWQPREYNVGYLFLDHLLASSDVRVAVTHAAQKQSYAIEKWLDERVLHRRQMKDVVTIKSPQGIPQNAAVVPDGYFLLNTGKRKFHHFLEVDMGTVTGTTTKWGKKSWARKIQVYLAYYRSGKYQEKYGTRSMRILTITTGGRRLANLKQITEDTGGKSRFWFTTLEQVKTSSILTDSIWQVAGRKGMQALL